jgi:hypothetical protein
MANLNKLMEILEDLTSKSNIFESYLFLSKSFGSFCQNDKLLNKIIREI